MPELPLPSNPMAEESQEAIKGPWGHIVDVVEQPLVLTALAILAALVDIISHVPTLLFVGFLVLLGFHRSRKVAGKDIWRTQIPSYIGLLVLVSVILFGVHVLLKRSTSQFVDEIIAKIKAAIPEHKPEPAIVTSVPSKESKEKSISAHKRIGEFRPKDATPCTMKDGKYYRDYLSLPGGPKLRRPMLVVNTGTLPYVGADVTGTFQLFLELVLTNRGEASIVKNWEVCLIHNNKPFIFDSAEIPTSGVLITGTSERITPEKSLVDNVIRTPIEHAHTAGGWVAFTIPNKELEDSLISGKEVVKGSIRFKDYLDHKYSFDFEAGVPGKVQTYVPGAPR